jgi:ATP-dependent DNA helicase RecG
MNAVQKLGLHKLGLKTFEDILRYPPIRYMSYSDTISVSNIKIGELVTLHGTLIKVEVRKSWQSKIPMTEAVFSDGISQIKLFWFNQAYIGKMYPEGSTVSISGKVEEKNNKPYISNPNIVKISKIPDPIDSIFSDNNAKQKDNPLIPIYAETKGVTSNFIYETIRKIISEADFKKENFKDRDNDAYDTLPKYIKDELSLPTLRDAVLYTHFPTNEKLTESSRKRFLFEEMLTIQVKIETERAKSAASPAYIIDKNTLGEELFTLHNITPTNAQKKVLTNICEDIKSGRPMQRLVEGDVGSGKTLVAAASIYETIKNKRDNKKVGTPLQAVYLAPTEILALQQYETLINMLAHTGIEIGYLSGKTAYKFPSKSDPESYIKVSRPQMIKWVQEGKISVLVGTHAVTKNRVEFKDLALIIIDEQHRFGVSTRSDLAHKKGDSRPEVPHLLSMTATPIPRTLALSIFGDLDLSIIDELPKGRKPIKTKLVNNEARKSVYEELYKKLELGEQAFIVCTKISTGEDDESGRKSVTTQVEKLKDIFGNENKKSGATDNKNNTRKTFVVAGIHSKMKNEEKENIMSDFQQNKIQILVATSLVEVGVNIPNANTMIIEDAQHFGLSQLHQLRGRIGRGDKESTCYIFSDSKNDKSFERMKNFANTLDGFKLAEIDFETRGAGSLISKNQSGMSDIAMEALKNIKLVEISKKYAKDIIKNDPTLQNFDTLRKRINSLDDIHLE